MATLSIVGTPIGNLNDITLRALETLKSADAILCEDTRVTKKLLDHYSISKPLIAYHQHSSLKKQGYIVQLLKEGKNLALVSDAGTPGISDPGNILIREIVDSDPSITIVPIPGPSALTTALSISGFPSDRFLFLGFPPHKKHRKQFFEKVIQSEETVVFYESPHRILKSLHELETVSNESDLVVCRELTKMFEETMRGRIDTVIKYFEEHKDHVRGEFVVVVRK